MWTQKENQKKKKNNNNKLKKDMEGYEKQKVCLISSIKLEKTACYMYIYIYEGGRLHVFYELVFGFKFLKNL
jgi:hypothetical protein